MKYTVVTGASSDIGMEICRELALAGHNLLLTDLDTELLEKCIQELPEKEKHLVLALDLSEENAKDIFEKFLTSHNITVKYAVFAAGILMLKPIRLVDYDSLNKAFKVSLFSIFSFIQVLTSKKINKKELEGIVLISSISAKTGTKGYSVYSSIKAAMLGLTKALAVELAPTTRVNAILPGGIRTRTTEFIYGMNEDVNPRVLLGEGRATDIANMTEYLLSEKSKWITGQEFIIDGGFCIN